MIHNETNLVVADNSGAKSVRVFKQYGGSHRKTSSIGDVVLCAVKDAIPNAKVKKSVSYHHSRVLSKGEDVFGSAYI